MRVYSARRVVITVIAELPVIYNYKNTYTKNGMTCYRDKFFRRRHAVQIL